jgi:hypothetical protein
MLPVSNDTVLRVVRARACPRTEPLNMVDIDDWAFRRNHSYGTTVCDMERRRIVTLLPDREMATVELGSLVTPTLPSYLAIVVVDTAKQLRRHFHAPYRLPIAGILWRTRARLS